MVLVRLPRDRAPQMRRRHRLDLPDLPAFEIRHNADLRARRRRRQHRHDNADSHNHSESRRSHSASAAAAFFDRSITSGVCGFQVRQRTALFWKKRPRPAVLLIAQQHPAVEIVEIGRRFHRGQCRSRRRQEASLQRLNFRHDRCGLVVFSTLKQRFRLPVESRQLVHRALIAGIRRRIGSRLIHRRRSGRAARENRRGRGQQHSAKACAHAPPSLSRLRDNDLRQQRKVVRSLPAHRARPAPHRNASRSPPPSPAQTGSPTGPADPRSETCSRHPRAASDTRPRSPPWIIRASAFHRIRPPVNQ